MTHDAELYELTVGLEVHCQLLTGRKLFSPAHYTPDAPANTQVEPVDFGLPGALPVLDMRAVELAVRAGLALGCTVHTHSTFDRKHYVYPDSPKGYQITQQHRPICTGGHIMLLDDALEPRHMVRIERIHIEEDAAKSTHLEDCSLIDFNRAGVPLIEIVTAPQLHSAEDAAAFLKELHLVVTSLGVCSGSLDQGAFRVDANVSVRRQGATSLGARVEIKNINSFKFVRDAIQAEAARQTAKLRAGGQVTSHTRHYDADTHLTHAMRDKESAADYRYMPDPDLPALCLTQRRIDELLADLPELPAARRQRYVSWLGLSAPDARTIVDDPERTLYFEQALGSLARLDAAALLASWVVQQWPSLLSSAVTPERCAALIELLARQVIHHTAARRLLELMRDDPRSPQALMQAHGLAQEQDPAKIRSILRDVLASHPTQLAQYRAGKLALLGFFMGQAMGQTDGTVDPALTKNLLQHMLDEPDP